MSRAKDRRVHGAAGDPSDRAAPRGKPQRQTLTLVVLVVALAGVVGYRVWQTRRASIEPRPLPDFEVTSVALPPRGGTIAAGFEHLPPEYTGIDLVHPIDAAHPMRHLYFSGTMGGGVAIGDIDADGKPDVYFVHGPGRNRLYRQAGEMQFEDVTEAAGVDGGDAWGTGAAMVDVNNDGWLDIYVCNYDAANLLYINRGDGTFDEQGGLWGVNLIDASMMPAFCDYDRDGDLDLYLLTYRFIRPDGRPEQPPIVVEAGRRKIAPGFDKYYAVTDDANGFAPVARSDGLLRNDGDGFTDVSQDAGIAGTWHGLSATWWDYNDDGWPDLYVANDFTDPDQLYRNNGDGTFTDVIVQATPHTSWYSMGADAADINDDGLADLLVADMAGTTHFKQKVSMGNMENTSEFLTTAIPRQYMRNALLVNSGADRFLEAGYLAGLAETDWTWTVKLADLDNDGRVDAYFTNGSPRNFMDADVDFSPDMLVGRTNWDMYEHTEPLKEANQAYRNLGDLAFENVSEAWGLGHVGISLAAAHADLDRDGDLDLVVANFDEPVSVYRNVGGEGRGILVQLEGTASNRFGLGAKLTLESSGGKQVRYLAPYNGFLSSNEPLVHFGLGDADGAEELVVEWPSGRRQVVEGLEVGKLYILVEPPEDAPDRTDGQSVPQPLYLANDVLAGVRHREQEYDDFRRQPLLPNKLSQLGPGMAWGDADGDGNDDLFVGGAAGDPGKLIIHDGHGGSGARFHRRLVRDFEADRMCEDMGAVWLDADADGDLDLYVASGGVEAGPGEDRLADRLYFNDGAGNLTRAAAGVLPDVRESSSAVSSADFDRDGDVDLFVGSRVIPGRYPLSPNSRLLQNDGGKFTDVTASLAPDLHEAGMVTGGLWSDADGDGWIDLLVTYEWGPVRLFRNVAGRLVDQTIEAGLAERTGWWNGIAGGDVDNDGDTDYVVTNFGLNTKYHASSEQPTLLYYGDFDNSGTMQLIEAEFEDQTLFPVRGKSCSTRAMPFLAEKFDTFRDFASASLADIYTPTCLDEAHRYAATTLESGVLLNNGSGRFTFAPLPRVAQIAPGFGVVVADLDLDGFVDICIAQNFYTPQPETGRMAGGVSLLLKGDGKGRFTSMRADASGIVVPGDAKSLAVADLNGDHRPDMVVGLNDAELESFVHIADSSAAPLVVRLAGPRGNPLAAGARISAQLSDGSVRTEEVYAGSGYLSQSSRDMYLVAPDGISIESIDVHWPDGNRTSHLNEGWQGNVELSAATGNSITAPTL